MVPLSARDRRLANRYELERELTADDQAVDWLARDTALDRRVVLRLLHPELARDTTATEHFWQAARAAARTMSVDEPRILDGGTDQATGQVFVVREWRDESAHATDGVTPGVTPGVTVGVTLDVTARPYAGGRRRGLVGPAAGRALPGWPLSQGRTMVLGLVLALAVGGGLVGASASAWLAWVNEPLGRPAQTVTLAPAVGAPVGQATRDAGALPPTLAAATPQSAVETMPLPTPRDTPAAGEQRRVVNTDGLGVALRVSPGGDRQPGQGYAEGAVVSVFEQQGTWARIRGADGREGWVLAVTLAPTSGAVVLGTPARANATSASGRQRVVNTEGLGVALRSAPDGERLPGRGYAEGTLVTVVERSGAWTHIRGDDGRDGWVPTVTLAPS